MKYSDFLSCWSCLGAFLEHLEALFESTSCVIFLQLVPEKLLVVPLMSRTVGNLFYKLYPVTLYALSSLRRRTSGSTVQFQPIYLRICSFVNGFATELLRTFKFRFFWPILVMNSLQNCSNSFNFPWFWTILVMKSTQKLRFVSTSLTRYQLYGLTSSIPDKTYSDKLWPDKMKSDKVWPDKM